MDSVKREYWMGKARVRVWDRVSVGGVWTGYIKRGGEYGLG